MLTARREVALAVALTVLGGALVVTAAGRTWLTAGGPGSAAGPVSGAQVHPFRAGGLVALAGAPAILATRRFSRLLLGLLLVVDAAAIAAGVVDVLADGGRRATAWPSVGGSGALLVLAGGVLLVLRGRGWPSMSARYDRSGDRPASTPEQGMWDSLDRGHDPTR